MKVEKRPSLSDRTYSHCHLSLSLCLSVCLSVCVADVLCCELSEIMNSLMSSYSWTELGLASLVSQWWASFRTLTWSE